MTVLAEPASSVTATVCSALQIAENGEDAALTRPGVIVLNAWNPARSSRAGWLQVDNEQVGRAAVQCGLADDREAVAEQGRRAPAMRFGNPRVQALAGALCYTLFAVTGITNKSLRALMTGLLGDTYTLNHASYDLARLRVNGLIQRVPSR